MMLSKKRKLSGQAAIEYLSIVGIALLLLTPIILVAQQHIKDLNNDTRMMLAMEAKNKIAAASDIVHAQGPPSTMIFVPVLISVALIIFKTMNNQKEVNL